MQFNSLIPEFSVRNLEVSLHFFCDLAGFEVTYERKEDRFAFLSLGGTQIMLDEIGEEESPWEVLPLDPPLGRGVNFSVAVEDVSALYETMKREGCSIRLPIEDKCYRCGEGTVTERHFLVYDPDGYLWRFCQDVS